MEEIGSETLFQIFNDAYFVLEHDDDDGNAPWRVSGRSEGDDVESVNLIISWPVPEARLIVHLEPDEARVLAQEMLAEVNGEDDEHE